MKKKILSTFLALILLCLPMFCLTGCGVDGAADTHFKASKTTIQVAVGTTWGEVSAETLSFEIDTKIQKLNPNTGEYSYITSNSSNEDGSTAWDFLSGKNVWYYSKGEKPSTTAITLSDAVTVYNVAGIGSWNTATATPKDKPRTLTLTYGGVTIEIEYTVAAAA